MKRFLKFCCVGGLGAVLDLSVYAALVLSGVHYLLAAAVAFVITATINYGLNRCWTFRDRRLPHSRALYARFLCVAASALGVNLAALFWARTWLLPLLGSTRWGAFVFGHAAWVLKTWSMERVYSLFAQIFGIAAAMVFNFLGSSLFTFRRRQAA